MVIRYIHAGRASHAQKIYIVQFTYILLGMWCIVGNTISKYLLFNIKEELRGGNGMNSDRSKIRVVSMAVTIIVALSMIVSAFAMVISVPGVVTGTDVSNEQIDAAPPSTMIRMKNAHFDLANGNPEAPSTLAISSYPDHIRGTYIVQKEGPITEEWKAEISRAGGEILGYIPDNAFLVRMENSVTDNVKSVRGNQWMGIYQPLIASY